MADTFYESQQEAIFREKRNYLRMPAVRRAFLETLDGGKLAEARLIDMSMAGARIFLEDVCDLPNKFVAKIQKRSVGTQEEVRCQVIWQDGSDAGVRFW